jgi:hypothetical protein
VLPVLVTSSHAPMHQDGYPGEGLGFEGFWQVDLTQGNALCSTMEQFCAIQIHIGNIHNVALVPDVPDEEYNCSTFRDIGSETSRRGDIKFDAPGLSIFSTFRPVSREEFDALSGDYDQFADVFNDEGDVSLRFGQVEFQRNSFVMRPFVGNQENQMNDY